ncbi:hypothetical protein AB0I60_14905 [Actinosynnema sp. NPDC050436]|uniref:hypothetical protein n=1 Tax=Actinosynnema sp. NPDC050436 TaxID=3155659 RepID=UPI0033D042A0
MEHRGTERTDPDPVDVQPSSAEPDEHVHVYEGEDGGPLCSAAGPPVEPVGGPYSSASEPGAYLDSERNSPPDEGGDIA